MTVDKSSLQKMSHFIYEFKDFVLSKSFYVNCKYDKYKTP